MKVVLLIVLLIESLEMQLSQGAISAYASNVTTLKAAVLNSATYDRKVRPEEKMTIQVRFNILAINELNIKGQHLSTSGWLTLKWKDSRLQWTQAGNPTYFFEDDKNLWVPELMVDNSVQSLGVIRSDNILLRVRYDGEVTWEPTGIFSTSCDIVISFYPFDRQRCQLEITSWAYNIDEQNLTFLGSGFNLMDYTVNGQWDLISTSTAHSQLVEEGTIFPQLDFIITTERRSSYYILNIILPISLTSVLSVIVFILPFESGEKVSYALTVLLSYAVLLTIVVAEMPPISNNVSLLAVYLALILVVGASTTFLSVINLYIYHQSPHREVPISVKRFTINFLCKATGWRKLDPSPHRSPKNQVLPVYAENNHNKEPKNGNRLKTIKVATNDCGAFYSWVEIAMMLDVLYFRLFSSLLLVITLTFLICLPVGDFCYIRKGFPSCYQVRKIEDQQQT